MVNQTILDYSCFPYSSRPLQILKTYERVRVNETVKPETQQAKDFSKIQILFKIEVYKICPLQDPHNIQVHDAHEHFTLCGQIVSLSATWNPSDKRKGS